MQLITLINDSRSQVFRFNAGPDNQPVDVLLNFVEQQQGWFISFDYLDFSLSNFRVVTSGNFLHQFRNLLPFGLSCVTEQDHEPMLQQDFLSKRCQLYILTSAEVIAFSEVVNGQAST